MTDYREILGVAPDAAPGEIEQRIKSELRLWQRRTNSADLALRQEAERRVEQLTQARTELLGGERPPANQISIPPTPSPPARPSAQQPPRPRPAPAAPPAQIRPPRPPAHYFAPEMPGPLKALRILFFIFGGLGVLVSLIALLGMAATPAGELAAATRGVGVAPAARYLLFTAGIAFSAAYIVFGFKLADGGQTLMKVIATVLGIGLVVDTAGLFIGPSDASVVISLLVSVLMLFLVLAQSSREYFAANDAV